jgi:hypothetical protein
MLRRPTSTTHHIQRQDINSLVTTSDLLLLSQLEVLGTLKAQLLLSLAVLAFKTQHNLLGGLSLLVKDRLGLTTITHLLVVVTSLTLF